MDEANRYRYAVAMLEGLRDKAAKDDNHDYYIIVCDILLQLELANDELIEWVKKYMLSGSSVNDDKCPNCHGEGGLNGNVYRCPTCKGTGKATKTKKCSKCNGAGWVNNGWCNCCDGVGYIANL